MKQAAFHLLIPFGLIVGLDYISALAGVLQCLATLYMLLQVGAWGLGFYTEGLAMLGSKDSPIQRIYDYPNLIKLIPLFDIGCDTAAWLLEEKDEKEPELDFTGEQPTGTNSLHIPQAPEE